jgi:hypothetical protein
MSSIKSEVTSAEGGRKIYSLTSSTEGAIDPEKMTDKRQAGANNPWDMVVEGDVAAVLNSLQTQLTALQGKVDWLSSNVAIPCVMNCATQILFFLHGSQPWVAPPKSYKFTNLATSNALRTKIEIMAYDANFTITADDFLANADVIVNDRNSTCHHSSCVGLDDELQRVLGAFKKWPELKVSLKKEYEVISNYAIIRSYF